jgi:flagellar L-ring protein precursor FlgH
MRYVFLMMLLAAGLLLSTPLTATSLFDEEGCDLITCDKASRIGDLVTILIIESTAASNKATTETEKTLNTDGEVSVTGFLQWIADLPPKIAPIEDFQFTPSEEFSGEGRVSTTGAFTTRITATVVEVLPNGNLLIEGTRDITIAEDTASLTIRGVVQPGDVTVDNTILSSQIAELEIIYEGEGIVADRQHDGILSRIFNFFF